MKKEYEISLNPQANSEQMVQLGKHRFTIITNGMVRLEYDQSGLFEDRATQTVVNRSFDKPSYSTKETADFLQIITSQLRLTFHKEDGQFTKNNLKVETIGNYSSFHSVWYFGEKFDTLKGTARTLDLADGAIPLEEGLMNKQGFSTIDDSHSMVLNADGWVENRRKGIQDVYFLGYGRDYLGTLKDYYQLTGPTPLLPRFTLGNWWSRYHDYSDVEYLQLLEKFQQENLPFSVAVVDMDWHITDVPKEYGSGWTGYTWDNKFFPNPSDFIQKLHEKGLKVSLNLHPANGVQPHEEMYEAMATELGYDTSKKEPINFDIANKSFTDAYFKHLHHPHEDIGIDFWWIDWQSGSISKVEGLDPLWMLNHYHFVDIGRDGKRPLIFSRYAGLGSHRYPVGFSGDAVVSWESLKFQPYFTATASNVGYSWWSHDIGGHMYGYKDDELYVRWLQFGVFSPINRLHSTSGPFYTKEPWRYNKQAEQIAGDYLRLRHKLIPYLYTMNYLTHTEGLPLMRPMYYQNPWVEDAYEVPNQYYFGTQLIVAPITEKTQRDTYRASETVWLPSGTWFDFFTGKRYRGNRKVRFYRKLDVIPVLAKAGGIIPLGPEDSGHLENPDELDIYIFPDGDGNFTLYEDSGQKADSQFEKKALTKIEWKWLEGSHQASLRINEARGEIAVLPSKRSYRLHFVGVQIQQPPVLQIDGEQQENLTVVKSDKGIVVSVEKVPVTQTLHLQFETIERKEEDVTQAVFEFLDEAQMAHQLKEKILAIVKNKGKDATVIGELQSLNLSEELLGILTEILWAH